MPENVPLTEAQLIELLDNAKATMIEVAKDDPDCGEGFTDGVEATISHIYTLLGEKGIAV